VKRLALITLLTACAEPRAAGAPEPIAEPTGDAAHGRELLVTFECNRCHEGAGLEAAPLDQQCVGCHQSVLDGTFDAPEDRLGEWRENLHSLNRAPSLAFGHLRQDWIERFLLQPHDVRPGLPATMPRLAITEEQAADIAAALTDTPHGAEPERAYDHDRASTLLRAEGCLSCHAFTGFAPSTPQPSSPAIELAPDLRFTRERLSRAALVRWLTDPQRVKPGALMPAPSLDEGEIDAVADLILHAPLAASPAPRIPERLPILERPVRFEEVAERVLHQSCWHCHADPDFARGDGGPGNSGGFGYPGRRVALHDYAGVSSGYLDAGGERRSMFAMDGDTPHLVRVLMARHHEEAGQPIEGITGMPLGLPPLPLEDIQLIETWMAQGRPL
jgi:hypothetical protein